MELKFKKSFALGVALFAPITGFAAGLTEVGDEVIAQQRAALAASSVGAGFGPQAPRDLRNSEGSNKRIFGMAPAESQMNLCNIHFHKGAEHAGGEFTKFLGNGDGAGHGTGYAYDGDLTEAELTPIAAPIGTGDHGKLQSGDTIEVHFVHTSADVVPGPTLGACIADSNGNPQLRVETQVMVLVNDASAHNFKSLAQLNEVDGYWQAPNVPSDTGTPILYTGSTTGPSYNEVASPFEVTWSVRPEVIKVDINSVAAWYEDNVFEEDHAHAVRNLVVNPALLSRISK
ncbi:delta-class carbonic anhydrase [Donghicola eburneus]|uniref:Putative secreted protein n=1 Tax=Donghicola eburneus TaxID=393278 RepID=A0A1M4MVA5_9RHOB|nr:delta-class carbonic anhydrase [Donghicola eburneus]SCM66221.1 putative secreted protein [Donghicola eburneus]